MNLPYYVYKSRCPYYILVGLYVFMMYFIPLYFTAVVNIGMGSLAVFKALRPLVFLSNSN